jgi:predicted nucleic acid-binding protein
MPRAAGRVDGPRRVCRPRVPEGRGGAPEVRVLLDDAGTSLTAVGLAEVIDHLVRLASVNEEEVVLDLAQLGLLDARAVDSRLGMAAGRLRARHYDWRRCQASLADCVAAEAARAGGEPLATADPDLLDVCHAEGVAVVVLPGSTGTRWSPKP